MFASCFFAISVALIAKSYSHGFFKVLRWKFGDNSSCDYSLDVWSSLMLTY